MDPSVEQGNERTTSQNSIQLYYSVTHLVARAFAVSSVSPECLSSTHQLYNIFRQLKQTPSTAQHTHTHHTILPGASESSVVLLSAAARRADIHSVPGVVEHSSQVPYLLTRGWLDIRGRIHLEEGNKGITNRTR